MLPRPLIWIDGFQSTPSVWRETYLLIIRLLAMRISIHSLRVEGDADERRERSPEPAFQSTPSVWRETISAACCAF